MSRLIKTTEDELKKIVMAAVGQKFKDVGIHAHDDATALERYRDFEFLHDLRTSTESAKGKAFTTLFVLAIGGIGAWLVMGFKLWTRQ